MITELTLHDLDAGVVSGNQKAMLHGVVKCQREQSIEFVNGAFSPFRQCQHYYLGITRRPKSPPLCLQLPT